MLPEVARTHTYVDISRVLVEIGTDIIRVSKNVTLALIADIVSITLQVYVSGDDPSKRKTPRIEDILANICKKGFQITE